MATVKLGDKAVGSIVKIAENNSWRDYIIVHKGRPSSKYDPSCDGVWLLKKDDTSPSSYWNTPKSGDYAASYIHTYLNTEFINRIDGTIRSYIKQVKIPYRVGGSGTAVASGSSGLSAKLFLLSIREITGRSTSGYICDDGDRLSYFPLDEGDGSNTASREKRIFYINGDSTRPMGWWLRSPDCKYSGDIQYVDKEGIPHDAGVGSTSSYGVRPAFILPYDLLVTDDGVIRPNTAPATPSSITIPGSIMGGSTITVKWSVSTDTENNLAGYKVEKSIDGGSTWNQIYQGTATQITDTVTFGTASVMYRVRAYDAEGLHSGYKVSTQVTVINNTAPGAPANITVPAEIRGGKAITISWADASDQDGNLSGYILERCINGGASWTQVYQEAALSYADTVTKGWSKVQYRVKAYDSYNAVSGYMASAERTVNNNELPTITCSNADHSNIGVKSEGFSISYSVNNEDASDILTVTETIDGAAKRSFTATHGVDNSFDITGESFMRLLNGDHVMTVSVTDGKESAAHTLNFTKSVTQASVTLTTPMPADGQIAVCVLSVSGSIPEDADLTAEVTNNGADVQPVWEDCTNAVKRGINHVFENKIAANGFAFNFRITVKRGDSNQGGFISSIQGGFQ